MLLFKKNSFWLAANYIIVIAVSLITLKMNLFHFGEKRFGLWLALFSLWNFGSMLDLGFGTALVKFTAEHLNKSHKEMNNLLSSSFVIYIIQGIIIFILVKVVSQIFYFSNSNFISSNNINSVNNYFNILGIAFYLRYLSNFFKALFEGSSKFIISSKILILNSINTFIAVTLVTLLDLSLYALAVGYLVISVAMFSVFFLFFKIKFNHFKINFRYFTIQKIKDIIGYSFAIQGASIFAALIDPVIKFIIGNFYQVSYISFYEIGRRFASAFSGLFFAAFRTILPKASILASVSDFKNFITQETTKTTKMGVMYSGLVFGICILPVAIFIKYVFKFDEVILIYLILVLPESINNFGFSLYSFLVGIGKAYFLVIVQMINVFIIGLSLTAGFYLSKSSLGLLGYFLTVAIVNILILWYSGKLIRFSIFNFLKETQAIRLVILELMLLLSVLIIYFKILNIYLVLGIITVISLLVFVKEIVKLISTFKRSVIQGLNNYA